MSYEKAVLAGGCFWGMQDLIRKQIGVMATRVGYTGGHTKNAQYKDVKTGSTGHAEAIEINFDPALTSYREILRFFFKIHDPTTLNRQGNDIGSQYRSAIFPQDEAQQAEAQSYIRTLNTSGLFKTPLATSIESAKEFYEAEAEHQDYLERIPNGYTCHFIRNDLILPM